MYRVIAGGIIHHFTGDQVQPAKRRDMVRDMSFRKIFWLGIPLLLLSFCAPSENEPTIRFPYQWLDVPGYGGGIDKPQLREPSGLCFHAQRGTLFGVGGGGEAG